VWCPNYEFFQYIRACQWLVPCVNCGSAVRFVLGTSVTVTLLLRATTRMRYQHLRRVRNWFSTVEKNTSKPKEKDIRNHLWPWKQMLAKVTRKRMYTRVILQQMRTTKWAIFTDARNGLVGTNVHKVWPGGKKVRTTCILDARNFFNQVPGRSYYKNAHWQSEVWVWPVNATQSWRRVQGQHQLAPKPTSRPHPPLCYLCVYFEYLLNASVSAACHGVYVCFNDCTHTNPQ